jgi:hypothetical protein
MIFMKQLCKGQLAIAIVVSFCMVLLCCSSVSMAQTNTSEFWLDQLDLQYATCGWRTPRLNKSVEGNLLRIGGKTFERGVGTHSEGRIWVKLHGAAVSISGIVGIDDEVADKGCAIFQVIGDYKVLWDSGKLRGSHAGKPFNVNLKGVEVLELLVLESEGGFGHDHSNWVDTKITYRGDRPVAIKADSGEFTYLQQQIANYKNNKNSERTKLITQQTFNKQALIFDTDRDAVDIAIRRTAALIAKIGGMSNGPKLSSQSKVLKKLRTENGGVALDDIAGRRKLFDKSCQLRRKVAMANPLLNFDKILFIKRHFNPEPEKQGNHMCDQFFGFHAIKGGGLFVLEDAFGKSPRVRNVLADSKVAVDDVNWRYTGSPSDDHVKQL